MPCTRPRAKRPTRSEEEKREERRAGEYLKGKEAKGGQQKTKTGVFHCYSAAGKMLADRHIQFVPIKKMQEQLGYFFWGIGRKGLGVARDGNKGGAFEIYGALFCSNRDRRRQRQQINSLYFHLSIPS